MSLTSEFKNGLICLSFYVIEVMHENPYAKSPPNFLELSKVYIPLREFLIRINDDYYTIDWKNEVAVREVTKAILYVDFKLRVDLASDKLCPAVSNTRIIF